jgi:hypothetical protein
LKRFFVGVAALLGLAGMAYACDDNPESHIYIAAQYEVASDCFGPSTSLALIDTPDGDLDCAPTCLVNTTSGGSTEIYVSTMCGPYPAGYDTSQTNAGCPAALAAWPAEQTALAAATNSCASPPTLDDAGEDSGAGGAAGDDGGGSDGGGPGTSAVDGGGDASTD